MTLPHVIVIVKVLQWRSVALLQGTKEKKGVAMLIRNFSLNTVELGDPVLENAFRKEQEYLRSIEMDRLLAGFRERAGLPKKADRYTGGWEDSEIAGHTLGHYLTALSQLYAATGAKDIEGRLDYLLQELSECQGENGFLFASPEDLFDKIERGEQAWVPWYTLHKVMTGLISAYLISAKLPRMRRWILRRIPKQRLQALRAGLDRLKAALTGWFLAQAKLMGLTLLILLAGFWLLRIPGFPMWALVVTAVDALPVLGTGTILLPWSLLCLLQQDAARALGLLGLYTTITLTRSMLEPKLVGRQLGLDSLATLMALYIGYKLWGIGGMILSPLLAVTALQLVPERS